MTASRAYLAGIGTTGVLIGFALLILAVVSALVAFRGWPGDTATDGAGAVTFGEEASLIELEPVRMGARSAAAGGAAGPGRAAASGEASAGGRFDVRGVAESETAQLEPGSAPVGAPGESGGPSVPATQEGGDVGGGLAEGIDEAAGAVGDVTAPVTTDAPAAGDGLGEALRGAGGAVREKTGELGLP